MKFIKSILVIVMFYQYSHQDDMPQVQVSSVLDGLQLSIAESFEPLTKYSEILPMLESILEMINNTISATNNYVAILTHTELATDSAPLMREIGQLTNFLRENMNKSCIDHYDPTINLFHKVYTNDLLNCERLRYLQLIESEISSNSSTILSKVNLMVTDVQNLLNTNNNVDEGVSRLISGTYDIVSLIQNVGSDSFSSEAEALQTCRMAVLDEANEATETLLRKFASC